MSNLTPEDVNTQLTVTRQELQLEDLRLWQGLEDEKISRIAGDNANTTLTNKVATDLAEQESRLSVEVVQRAEGDIRNITSLTELASALADYRIKTDLELANEKIAREQLGIDLNTRVDDFISTIDFKFIQVQQAIQFYQDDTNQKLGLFDERITKYEEMLQDITTDSIQIFMDNGEINMGAWTILSQARQWDLEILGKFKDYQAQTDKDIDEALKDIQDQLPVEQDIIDKAIDALSNAQIIKDLDAKIDGNIADVNTVQAQLIQEVTDRQNQMIDYSQTIANELKKNQDALVDKIQTESDARIDALQRESAIRQQELLNESAERSAEITERIKDIEAGTGADLTEVNKRIDEANNYIESVKDGLDAERDERLASIATMNDGLTKEIQFRKDGDLSITTSLNNYKASNDVAMANFRDEVTVVADSNKATVIKVDALDASLKTTNTKLNTTTQTAATALEKSTLALTETSALAQRVTLTEADMVIVKDGLETKANASAVQLLESRVETIDGEVKASSQAITKLTSDLTGVKDDLDQKVDASVLDAYSTTVQMNSAIASRVQEYDANLYIGGQNIWSVVDNPHVNAYGTTTKSIINVGEEHYRMTINAFTTSNICQALIYNALVDTGFIFKQGDDFTVSFEVRANRNAKISALYFYMGGVGVNLVTNQDLTTEWVRLVFPLKASGVGVVGSSQMFGTNITSATGWAVNDWIEFRHVQMQRGKKATEFQKATAKVQQGITANASAITGIKAEVTNHEGRITSNSNSIVALNNSVAQVNQDLSTKASSQALTDLKSSVEVIDGKVTSNAQNVVQLNNDVTQIKGDLKNVATSSALQALDSRVVTAEGKIESQQSAITKLTGDLATTNTNVSKKADAQAVTALDQRVVIAEGKISSQSTQLTNLQNNLTVTNNNLLDSDLIARMSSQGKALRDDPTFLKATNMVAYQPQPGATLARQVASTDNPVKSGYEVLVRSTAALGTGWLPQTPYVSGGPNKILFIKQVLKMPVGLRLVQYSNATGTGGIVRVLGNIEGTGKFDVYYAIVHCGPDSATTIQGHFRPLASLVNTPPVASVQNPVDVIIGSYEVWDVTGVADIPKDWADKITANATAMTELTSKVTSIEGTVTSHSSQITNLTNRVDKTERDINTKADSSALATLDSKVTTIGNKVDASAADIVTLKNRVTVTEGDIAKKADATALNTLTTRVEKTENDFKTSSDQITMLTNNFSSSAEGISLNSTVSGFVRQVTTGDVSTVADNIAMGGKVVKLGSEKGGAGGDTVWMHGPNFIPVDPKRLYRVKARIRRVKGNGTLYIGLACKNADKTSYIQTNGTETTNMSASNYLLAAVSPALGVWQEYEWFVYGRAAGGATGTGTLLDPRKFQNNAAWFTPMLIANYLSNTASYSELDYITVEYADEYPLLDAAATATNTLSSKVDVIDGKVTTLTSSVTQLTGRVNTVENGLSTKAEVSALNALDARVVQNGKDIEANSASVTRVDSRIDNLTISTNNVLLNSYGERSSTAPTQREYLMYERSPELKAFYDENLGKDITITFEALVPVAGSLQVYSSNNSAHNWSVATPVIPADTWTKVTVKVKPAKHATNNPAFSSLEFYGTYNTGRIPTLRKVMMVAGSVAAEWQPSPRDDQAQFQAQSDATASLQSKTDTMDGKITTNANSITQLNGRLTTAEGKVTVNTNAITGLDSKITTMDGKIDTQVSNVTRLQARVDNNAGPGLSQDYNCVNADSWYDHSNLNTTTLLEPFFNKPIDGAPTGPNGFSAPEGVATRFIYNRTPFPTTKRYRVQFWAKATTGATGADYITYLRMKPGEAPTTAAYSYTQLPVNTIPRTNTWTFIDRTLDFTSTAATYSNVRIGFGLNNGVTAGAVAVVGFKVTEQIDAADAPGLATADALTSLTTRVQTAEGKIDTQAGQITSLTTQVAGKANSSAVTSLETRVTTAEGNITNLSTSTTTLGNRVTTAEGKITTNTNSISTMNNKITEIDGTLTSQSTALTKVQATLDGQIVGSNNLLRNANFANELVSWNAWGTTNAVRTVETINGKKWVHIVANNTATFRGLSQATTANSFKRSTQYTITFNAYSVATTGGVQLVIHQQGDGNNNPQITPAAFPITNVNKRYSYTFTSADLDTKSVFNFMIGPQNGVAGDVYITDIMFSEGNVATGWSPSNDEAKADIAAQATAITNLDTKVTLIDGKVTTQATQITQLQTDVGNNSAKLNITAEVVDGLKAGYYVKTDVNGLVAGFGLYNDGTGSVFGVNADYFYIGKGTGGKKPFIVTTTTQTIDGVTYPVGTWIHTALIASATIGTAHIADAAITNAKIANLDASKITTGVLNANRIKVGPTSTFEPGYDPSANLQSAKDYTDITTVEGSGKVFHNPASRRLVTASTTNVMVIKTPITLSNYMCVLDITGFNYTAAVGNAFKIELGFYANLPSQPFVNNRVRVTGLDVSSITLALDPTTNKVVILIAKSTAWSYPQATINTATIMHTNPPDTFKLGWTIGFETDVSGYTNKVVVNSDVSETVAGAQAKADTVNAKVLEFSTDGILSSPEKKQVKTMWDEVAKEYPTYIANAGSVSVTTTAYTNAYSTLNTYLTPLLSNLNVNSTIVRATFQANFANYYDERTKLIKAINDALKAIGDAAKGAADSKARTYITQPTTPYTIGDIWKSGTSTFICMTARASGAFVAGDWTKVGDVTSENTALNATQLGGTPASTINTNISNADSKATNAASAAATADGKAVAAQTAANNADAKAVSAQTAATNAATAAGNKGEVIYGSTAPAAAKQLAQNLWIDTTGNANTPKRWNGSAWVAVTDKAATDAKTAADNADAKAAAAAVAASNADAKAVAADVKASGAKNQVDAWTFTGTTEINGGKIRADTITAVQLSVSELSAISTNLGTMITYADPSKPTGARTEISGASTKVYYDNGQIGVFIGLE